MNNNLTEMIFILDMSGSMSSLKDDTIGGYNSLIAEQKKQPGDANITTVLFDNRYILLHDRINIKEVKELTSKDYMPCGMTAMLDAIGRTVVAIGQKLADTPEENRPGNVVVTIITDGFENASKEYTWSIIKNMIKEQRDKYNWTFTFIGANIDVDKVSEDLGIDSRFAKKYTASKAGTNTVYDAVAKSVSFTRKVSAKRSSVTSKMSEEEMLEMSSILDDIQ